MNDRSAYNRQYNLDNNERIRAQRKARRLQDKLDCFAAYGGVCYCCGEDHLGFLTLEHLNDDGGEWRRGVLGRNYGAGGDKGYRWLRDHGYPQDLGLAVACFNCNSGRAANGGVCPHQQM